MKFTTEFTGVSKDELSEKLQPGIYDVIIKGVKHKVMDSGSESLNVTVEALESEGANVGKVAFGTLWIVKKDEPGQISEFGEKRIKEVLEALELSFPEKGEFTFDTDDWKNIPLKVQVSIEKGSKKDDGTYYDDKINVSRFLTEEEAEILLDEQAAKQGVKKQAQSAIAKPAVLEPTHELDVLDDPEETVEEPVKKVVKKAAKKVAKKPVAKKAAIKEGPAPVVEETPLAVKETVVEETAVEDDDELTDADLDIFEDME